MFAKLFLVLAFVVDLIALFFVVYATCDLLRLFWKHSRKKIISDKDYHLLRSSFVHRIILALDLFIAGDFIKLVFASTIDNLVQILLIVIIRTILSQYLLKEIKAHK